MRTFIQRLEDQLHYYQKCLRRVKRTLGPRISKYDQFQYTRSRAVLAYQSKINDTTEFLDQSRAVLKTYSELRPLKDIESLIKQIDLIHDNPWLLTEPLPNEPLVPRASPLPDLGSATGKPDDC